MVKQGKKTGRQYKRRGNAAPTKGQKRSKRGKPSGKNNSRNGNSMVAVTGSQGRIITPVSQRTGWQMGHSNAPMHPDLGKQPGHRLTLGLSPVDLYRGTTNANKCFWAPDAYAYAALTPNPIYISGTTFERTLGQNTPMQIIAKLYQRYALRGLRVHYTPTAGINETGTCIMIWNPVGPTELPYATFAAARNVQGAFSFPLNKAATFDFISDVDNQAAKRLYYVDPTNVAVEELAPGFLMAFMDQADGTGRSMGQLWVEMVYDLYNIQGNIAPSMESSLQKQEERRLKQLSEDLKALTKVPVERQSASTSSATTTTCRSVDSKEVREDFYLVPRSQKA